MVKLIFILLATLLCVQGTLGKVVENKKPYLRAEGGDSSLQQRNLKLGCPATISDAFTATCTPGVKPCSYDYAWKPTISADGKCGGSSRDATCSPLSTCNCANDGTWECAVISVAPCSNWALGGPGPAWAFKSCTPVP